MDSERWRRVRRLFESALEVEGERRETYLEEACAGDLELLQEVLELLESDQAPRGGVAELVARVASDVPSGTIGRLDEGDRLGRYTVLEKLGEGGMGAVYVVEDRELGRTVALKVLTGLVSPGGEEQRRFRREARVLASLNHPNIVTIHSVEQEGDLHFITMELVAGSTLEEIIPAEGFSVTEMLDIAVPLSEALAGAHEHGVVHRDLKPANVIVTGDGVVKVLDFGLAKLTAPGVSDLPSDSLTRTGVVMGTFPYMSPEQVQGGDVDGRSDVFSLGVMLYEMATGARPFAGESSAALIASILNDEPSPVSSLGKHVPPRLSQIIKRCLRKDPAARYPDTRSLAKELAALRDAVLHHPRLSTGLGRLSALVSGSRLSRRVLVAAGIAGIAAIAVLLDIEVFERAAQPKIASLAVLPLTNLSGDEEQEFLADGMTEVLITELSKVGALKVISRTSVMRFKNPQQPLAEIAEELGVDAVVEGSVARSGERVRVTAQLIHAASDEHLWAESFERDLRDLLTLQGEVARAIAAQVQGALTPEVQARIGRGEVVDPQASEAYLRGRHYWNEFAFAQAAEAYEEAISLDPEFARAHAGLAKTRQIQGAVSFPHPPKVSFSLARSAVDRALELDNELAEAHAVVGWIALQFEWDWETAEQEFRRAIELSPSGADGHTGLAYYLAAMGRFDEAVASARRARELDPLARVGTIALSEILYYARRYEQAMFELGEDWDVGFAPTHWMHDRILQARGDTDAAAWTALRYWQTVGFSQQLEESLERRLEAEGVRGFWQEMIQFYTAWPQEAIHARVVAENHARLGDLDSAFEWLERALERRDALFSLGVEPIWDPLREDPRFNELLIRLDLPQAVDAAQPSSATVRSSKS